jgi:hypothetical protein
LAVDTPRSSWFAQAEDAIRALRDVDGATVLGEGEVIREIHVLTRSSRPAKQIVRDVQTVLQTRFSRSIDYRVVSVAYLSPAKPSGPGDLPAAVAPRPLTPAPAVEAPAVVPAARATPTAPVPAPPSNPVPAAAPAPAPAPAVAASRSPAPTVHGAEEQPVLERIRFGSVNLFVSGARTQAQVELRWKGLPRMGSASGWSTRDGAHRMVAQATLAAVQEFLADEVALGVQDLEFLRLGRSRVVVVSLSLLVGRQEKTLAGTCAVEQDVHQAVVLATLAALNRVVGGLRPRETTEYILRPTSSQ